MNRSLFATLNLAYYINLLLSVTSIEAPLLISNWATSLRPPAQADNKGVCPLWM